MTLNQKPYVFASPLPHPGELLREEFLPAYGLTAGSLAKAMKLKDRTRVERIIRERQPITADTALRLGRVFGTTPQLWLNLQVNHDLSKAALEVKSVLQGIAPIKAPRVQSVERKPIAKRTIRSAA